MDDAQIHGTIEQLVAEEHELREREAAGSATDADRQRLDQLKVSLDQCWDFLRQRRALREAGLDPDAAAARPSDVVENYSSAVAAVAREGGCSCAAVRYRLSSRSARPLLPLPELPAADRQRVCHQRSHRDRSPSSSREPEPVDVPRDRGKQRIWRCPTCQVAVYSKYTSPKVRFVRAGTLDDPSSVQPDVHIFTRSKLPWVALPEGGPAYKVYYDMNKLWPRESLDRLAALRR